MTAQLARRTITLAPDGADESAFGPVEVEWYPDRLRITALGAGQASITDAYLSGDASQDISFEIRLPGEDEGTEIVPGAD